MKARRLVPVGQQPETLALERDRLKLELAQAREDLVFFGQHLPSCAYCEGGRPCTCGLLAAIARFVRPRA